MRILHTSDWHLGRSFHGVGMLQHQAAYVDDLIRTIADEAVDLVVVSGDVYDRALPPVDAVELAEETLVRLAASRARVVLTSGNHDSHQRLGFASRLIDTAGVHVRTHARDVGSPVLLDDEHGPVAVYGLPYLEPDHLREPWGLAARSHEACIGEALSRVRADLAGRPAGTRSVVMAHAFVAGGQPSDSERDISVGGVQLVPVSLFEGFDYVALGHLHGRQQLAPGVRYSGSPLAYSFSEADHIKGAWLVDLDASGLHRVEFVPSPVPRRLRRLRGRLEDLLTDPDLTDAEDAWLQVVLTDPARPAEAKPRLERRFPGVLSLGFEPDGAQPRHRVGARVGHELSDRQICRDFVADVRGRPATDPEAALLEAACDACRHDPESDRAATA
ncbi:MAG: metallophosphoesterase family protein [Marmoricola sp.]